MMEIMQDFPEGVLAVKAEGRVTKKDYDEVLIPAAKAAFARHGKLRVYYEIAPEFSGFDAGAIWQDFLLGIGHWTRWERVAAVTDEAWIRNVVAALSFLMPCPVKIFPVRDAASAREWVTA